MDSYSRSSKTSHHHQDSSSSPGDLVLSAQVVAEAGMSVFQHEFDKVDKGRTAGAAADLIHAASQYGHLENKPVGQYIEKAEDYLYEFHSSSATQVATYDDEDDEDRPPTAPKQKPNITQQSSYPSKPYQSAPVKHIGHGYVSSGGHQGDGDDKSEGSGVGDYMKLAQGLLKKQGSHQDEEEETEAGGVGDYLKLAQGFMKKH